MSSVGSILSGTPAALSPVMPIAAGAVDILGGSAGTNVANTRITANSIVVASLIGAADATLTLVGVRLNVGVGFSVVGNAAATGLCTVRYAVLEY